MRAVTHDGSFHADDVFSWALVSSIFPEAVLQRTRDQATIVAADIVFDVGMIFEPTANRFDHHMRDRPLRPNGYPYSAFGLLWRHWGREYLAGRGVPEADIGSIWDDVDIRFVQSIDLLDNGIGTPSPTDVSSLVEQFNGPWDAPERDSRFHDATAWAKKVLENVVEHHAARRRAATLVGVAATRALDERVLELITGMPWEDAVFDLGLDELLYVVHPKGDLWYAKAVPTERGRFGDRLSFPQAWRGLSGKDLAVVCGVQDADFCHSAGFIIAARSSRGLREMIDACFEHNDMPKLQQGANA